MSWIVAASAVLVAVLAALILLRVVAGMGGALQTDRRAWLLREQRVRERQRNDSIAEMWTESSALRDGAGPRADGPGRSLGQAAGVPGRTEGDWNG
jgi:hypothetical protein